MSIPKDEHACAPRPVVLRREARLAETLAASAGFRVQDIGLAAATAGRFAASIFRATGEQAIPPRPHAHDADLQLVYVLQGEIEFRFDDGPIRLSAGDAVYQPAGCVHCVTAVSEDLELIEITGPATIATTPVIA